MIQPKQHWGGWSKDTDHLSHLMHPQVVNWLGLKQKQLLLDYLNIKEGWKEFGIGSLTDYSYLITPAFKALEGAMLQLAQDLGFEPEKVQFKTGVIFNDENLQKFYEDVLNKIEEISHESKEDIQIWLSSARRILRHYRHSPAHFNGEVKENWDKAFMLGDQIISVINDMCFALLQEGLIGKKEETG